jgi:hypothetical protein
MEQAADRPHHVERPHRADQILADAAADQVAVEHDVVEASDHDDAGAGVADLGELVERGDDVLAVAAGLEDDHVGRRRRAIGFDRRRRAAHLDLDVRLGHAPVVRGAADGGRGVGGLAEGLDRDARRRRDVVAAIGDVRRALLLVMLREFRH